MADFDLVQEMRFVVDPDKGLITLPQRTHLAYGDANANRIVVEVVRKGEKADLTGMSVTGAFYRPGDGAQIPLEGEVDGNEARVLLNKYCYTDEGQYEAEVRLTQGGVTRTILSITGYVHRAGSGAVVDVDGVIPSLDAILAQLQSAKDATDAANAAAANADGAAERANEAAETAEDAVQAVKGWENAEATVEMLPAGSEPVVNIDTAEDGHRIIRMQLPRGETGAMPVITFRVKTGEPGTDVLIEQSGTAEAPEILLTIPRGDTGSVDGIDYYAGEPAALGVASPGTANGVARGNHVHPMPTASEVKALPENGTAVNSDKLGGVDAAKYALKQKYGKLVVFGDSIGQGYGNDDYSFVDMLSEAGAFASVVKACVAGATIGPYSHYTDATGYSLVEQIERYAEDVADADIVICEYEGNDYWSVLAGNVEMGLPTDDATVTTVSGYTRKALERIIELNPDVRLMWLPISRNNPGWLDTHYADDSHNADGYRLFEQTVMQIAVSYGCSIVPIYEAIQDDSLMLADGLHPATAGHRVIADTALNNMLTVSDFVPVRRQYTMTTTDASTDAIDGDFNLAYQLVQAGADVCVRYENSGSPIIFRPTYVSSAVMTFSALLTNPAGNALYVMILFWTPAGTRVDSYSPT